MKDDFDKRSSNHEFDVHEVRKITLNSIQTRHSTIIESINKQIEEAARNGQTVIRRNEGVSARAFSLPQVVDVEPLAPDIILEIMEYYNSLGFKVHLSDPGHQSRMRGHPRVLQINWDYNSVKPRQLDTNHPFIKSALE